jgi:hypothetical protein
MSPSKYAADYKEGNDTRIPWKLLKKNESALYDNQIGLGVQSMEEIIQDDEDQYSPERMNPDHPQSHITLPKINAQNLEQLVFDATPKK